MVDKDKLGVTQAGKLVKGNTLLIYAVAGAGKTTLLNTVIPEDLLVISIDSGQQVLNPKIDMFHLITEKTREPEEQISRFENFATYLLESKDILPWKVIALDNISELQDAFLEKFQKARGVKFPSKLEYRNTGIMMKRWLKAIRNLNYKGIDVIYIAWEDADKIEDKGGEIWTEKGPMIMGKTEIVVSGLVDFVLCLRVGKKGERYLQLDGDSVHLAKKREEWGAEYPSYIPCPKGDTRTLQDFLDKLRGGGKVEK